VAGLVNRMEDYKYSSYPAYLSDKQTILNKQEVLDWFGGSEAFSEHHKLMMDEKEMNKYFEF
jgi:putative transposase